MKLLQILIKNHIGPIHITAMLTWGIVGYIIVRSFPSELGLVNLLGTYTFLGLYFVGMQMSWYVEPPIAWINKAGLFLMMLCIIGLGWTQPVLIYLILLVIFSGILIYFYSVYTSAFIIGIIYIITLCFAIFRWEFTDVFLNSLTYVTFAAFAFFASHTAQREAQAREELAIANQQLLATQQLLTDSAVNDERLRISRDLHDAIGHHLTAMSLQLEVARKLAKDKALEHVEQAHSLTKLLLTDVREVVSDLRNVPSVDIHNSLIQLANSAKAKTELTIDPDIDINKSKVAETLFRLVQEMITNSNRYSKTGQLKIHLGESDKGWHLQCDDGGVHPVSINPGAGIVGMRERVEQLNGRFKMDCEQGLRYDISLPKHD